MRIGFVQRTLESIASRLGLETGQMYTVATGLVVATVLGIFGIAPVLGDGQAGVETSAATALPAPTTVPSPGALVPSANDGQPEPSPAAAPPTTVAFRPPPPPARDAAPTTTTTSTTTTTPAPRPPIPGPPPSEPDGTTTVFAHVPLPGAPEGVGVGPDGVVYVATNNAGDRGGLGPSEVIAFTATGTLIGSYPVPGQPDDRTNGLTGLAVDRVGRVVVADASTNRILRLDPSRSELSELVTIPDLPLCVVTLDGDCEPGALDGAPELRGVSLTPDGAILVADRGQGIVWRYDDTTLEVLWAADNRAPGEGPTAAARRDDALVVAMSGVADSVPPGQAAVVSVVDGTATTIARYDSSAGLAGLAVGRSGRIYVTLAAEGAVEVITDSGEVVAHHDGGAVDPAFDTPTGIAVGNGRLLVTNQSTVEDDPDHWVVYGIAVDDRPQPFA